jgi:hypothetical protein
MCADAARPRLDGPRAGRYTALTMKETSRIQSLGLILGLLLPGLPGVSAT